MSRGSLLSFPHVGNRGLPQADSGSQCSEYGCKAVLEAFKIYCSVHCYTIYLYRCLLGLCVHD
jgi:hypothetical protein